MERKEKDTGMISSDEHCHEDPAWVLSELGKELKLTLSLMSILVNS